MRSNVEALLAEAIVATETARRAASLPARGFGPDLIRVASQITLWIELLLFAQIELLFCESAIGDDKAVFDIAEPPHRKIVSLPRNGDRAVRTATTLVNPTLGDDLDEKHI